MKWALAGAFALLFASPARADEEKAEPSPITAPPAAPLPDEDPLRPSLSGSWQSELIMSQRPRLRYLGNGFWGQRTTDGDVYPFYNTLSLRADDAGARGLSIHFQGWAGIDLADVQFGERVVGDPTYLYVEYASSGIDLRLGRQLVWSGAARGLRIDGATFSYQTPANLGVEMLGGLVVTPDWGPDWYAGESVDKASDFGAAGSDWDQEYDFGDWAMGGRLFYRMAGRVSAGVSILEVRRMDELDKRLFGADLDLVPFKWAALSGDALLDLPTAELQEASVGLDVYPHEVVAVALDYRHENPTLYVSRLSIFSVFSDERYDAAGGAVRVFPLTWLTVTMGYHQHFYGYIEATDTETGTTRDAATEYGYELEAGARATYGRAGGLVRLDFRRFSQDRNGANQVRLGGIVPLHVAGLRATANVYLDLYDEDINGEGLGVVGDVGLFWTHERWEAGGALTAGVTPYAAHELLGLVKLGYDFDWSFAERRQP